MADTDNLVSLREYVDRRFLDLEKQIAQSDRHQQIALDKADKVLSYRLEGMNEFRASLTDQTRSYVTRNEYLPQAQNQADKIESLQWQMGMIAGGLIVLQLILRFI